VKILLIGFGGVGQTLAQIFLEKSRYPNLKEFNPKVVGICTKSHGSLSNPSGINLKRALDQMKEGGFRKDNPEISSFSPLEAIEKIDFDVLVELSTLSIESEGEPARTHVQKALEKGCHVVTANKGPIAFAYQELSALAHSKNVKFLFESTVMDGTPVFNLARHCLKGCQILSLEGILNSTSNFVLSSMEAGLDMEKAIEEAQRRGFAERNPLLDLEGWDSACKISALANVLMGGQITPLQVEREGIRGLKIDDVERAKKEGKHFKLICRAWKEDGIKASVKLETFPSDHHYSSVVYRGTILRIETDLLAPIFITATTPSLYYTAYGVLNDLLEIWQR